MSLTIHRSLECLADTPLMSSPALNANPSKEALSKTPDACHIVAMDRTDSGFGENPTTPDSSLSRASSLIKVEEDKVYSRRRLRLRSQKAVVSEHIATPSSSPHRKASARCALRTSPQYTAFQRTSSHLKSSTPGSHRSSRSSSQRSLPITQSATSSRRPPLPNRSITTTYARPTEDPVALYQRSRSLFESSHNALEHRNAFTTLPHKPSSSLSLPSFSHPSMETVNDLTFGLVSDEEENPFAVRQYSNHVPATIIDWTLPSTRRREYRKIESSCRGIPGLWRRFVPRFLQRNRRLSFYEDEKDDNAGSVRRYRMDLPEDEEEKTMSVVKSIGVRPSLQKAKRTWSCLGSFRKSSQGSGIESR